MLAGYCDKSFYQNLSADDLKEPKARYHLARLVCIIGEACKHFSNDFEAMHPEFPQRELTKLRDILVHYHFLTTAADDDAMTQNFYLIKEALVTLSEPFAQLFKNRLTLIQQNAIALHLQPSTNAQALSAMLVGFRHLKQERQLLQTALAEMIPLQKGNLAELSTEEQQKEKKRIKRIKDKQSRLDVLEQEYLTVKAAIHQQRLIPNFEELLEFLKKRSNQTSQNDLENTLNNLKNVANEITLLKAWQAQATDDASRNFALEHSALIIAENYKTACAAYHRHVSIPLTSLVAQNLSSTISTRNTLLAHAPFQSHTEKIKDSIDQIMIPTYSDITAISVLTQQQVRNILDKTEAWSVDAWYEFALAHVRLNRYDLAEFCLLEIIQLLTDNDKLHASLQQQHSNVKLIIVDDEPLVIEHRIYRATTLLGKIYIKQQRFQESLAKLELSYKLFCTHHRTQLNQFTLDCPSSYLCALLGADDPRAPELYTQILRLMTEIDEHADDIAVARNSYAIFLNNKKRHAEAAKIYDQIDTTKIKSPYLRLSIQLNQCNYRHSMLSNDTNEFKQLFEDTESLLKSFSEHKKTILSEIGQDTYELEDRVNQLAKKAAHSYAAQLSNTVTQKPGLKDKHDLANLEVCAHIQNKYNIDTRCTYFNIGLIYYNLSTSESSKSKKNTFLKLAVTFYEKSFHPGNAVENFAAFRQISFAHEDLGEVDLAIRFASKAYCMLKKVMTIPEDFEELSGVIRL